MSGAEGGRGIVKVLFLPLPGKNGEGGSSEEKVELLFRSPKGGEKGVWALALMAREEGGGSRLFPVRHPPSYFFLSSFLSPPPTRACEGTKEPAEEFRSEWEDGLGLPPPKRMNERRGTVPAGSRMGRGKRSRWFGRCCTCGREGEGELF